MAEKNKDHLADALAALSAGHHDEPEAHDHDEPAPPPPPAPPRSAPPKPAASARPSAPVPSAPRPTAPAPAAKPIAQARPAAPSAPAAKARPTAPRPATPAPPTAARTATPTAPPRSNRPQAPAAPAVEEFAAQEDSSAQGFVEQNPNAGDWVGAAPPDDDAMLAPAPDASAFTASSLSYKTPASRMAPKSDLKPTLIPILLTSGLLLIVFGSLKFVLGPDSPYANLPSWVTGMMFGMGALVLALAAFTMLQVKEQLTRAAAKKK